MTPEFVTISNLIIDDIVLADDHFGSLMAGLGKNLFEAVRVHSFFRSPQISR